MSDSTHLRGLLSKALRALNFYADPRNWPEGTFTEMGPHRAREAMSEIAYCLVPEDSSTLSVAPWSKGQVDSLNGYQESSRSHPFTYGDGTEKVDLIATDAGWVAYPGGPVVQAWSHRWMADWSWRVPAFYPLD